MRALANSQKPDAQDLANRTELQLWLINKIICYLIQLTLSSLLFYSFDFVEHIDRLWRMFVVESQLVIQVAKISMCVACEGLFTFQVGEFGSSTFNRTIPSNFVFVCVCSYISLIRFKHINNGFVIGPKGICIPVQPNRFKMNRLRCATPTDFIAMLQTKIPRSYNTERERKRHFAPHFTINCTFVYVGFWSFQHSLYHRSRYFVSEITTVIEFFGYKMVLRSHRKSDSDHIWMSIFFPFVCSNLVHQTERTSFSYRVCRELNSK